MDDQTQPKPKPAPELFVPAKLSVEQRQAIEAGYLKLAALEWRYRQAKDPLRKDEAKSLRKAVKQLAAQFPFLEELSA